MVDLIKLTNLLDEAKCYEVIRQLRWPDGVVCLHCRGTGVVRNGHDDRERHRQRYLCKTCKYRFDDLTGTVLAGHHQPVSTWILGSYFMGVNLSNRQIAHELGLCESDAQAMTEVLRHGIVAKTPDVVLSGDVEFDELYVVAGHKGNPEAVRAKGREGRRNRLKGGRGRGTLEKEKPPIFGMIERGGQVVIRMLANVQQATIHPIIEKTVAKGSNVSTPVAGVANNGGVVGTQVTDEMDTAVDHDRGVRLHHDLPHRGHQRLRRVLPGDLVERDDDVRGGVEGVAAILHQGCAGV